MERMSDMGWDDQLGFSCLSFFLLPFITSDWSDLGHATPVERDPNTTVNPLKGSCHHFNHSFGDFFLKLYLIFYLLWAEKFSFAVWLLLCTNTWACVLSTKTKQRPEGRNLCHQMQKKQLRKLFWKRIRSSMAKSNGFLTVRERDTFVLEQRR